MTIAIAIHGGAGTLRRQEMTPEKDRQMREGLSAALEAGHRVLREGGTSLDAVIASVTSMEDNPLFNAGKGAVFTLDGTIELEAAVMDGASRDAGTVTGVTVARNPVRLARRVMEATPHVTLGFSAADAFARKEGLECVSPDYYYTERRWQALQEEKARIAAGGTEADVPEDRKHGTIGAVALDERGRLAAATSTGGRTAKWPGRVGDTAIIGAGTWADETCAVSCTGHGEMFIRAAAAHDVAARMAYLGQTLREASDAVVRQTLVGMGGTGGMIAVDAKGNVAMPLNCEGMYRGMVDGQGTRMIAIYGDE
ncbi:MAG TPA: isoaspartyl peptidase/L-asparaginase [Holophaga sp.]|nr:isoaspartyl peptidase/L-asparaginase [Holophaga sp.]HPS66834.1 isoaspartyl peptidase/L-asparaginase [Holophaga sp.]